MNTGNSPPSGSETGELLLLQARYVLQNLNAERPGCGYDKLADACERAALTRAQPQADGEARTMIAQKLAAFDHNKYDQKTYYERADIILALRPTPSETACDQVRVATGVYTDQPIFDAIAAATSIDNKPDGWHRIVINATKFIEVFNNHRDRKLCISLAQPEPSACDQARGEWRVVPVIPTAAMVKAAANIPAAQQIKDCVPRNVLVYQAMVNAVSVQGEQPP